MLAPGRPASPASRLGLLRGGSPSAPCLHRGRLARQLSFKERHGFDAAALHVRRGQEFCHVGLARDDRVDDVAVLDPHRCGVALGVRRRSQRTRPLMSFVTRRSRAWSARAMISSCRSELRVEGGASDGASRFDAPCAERRAASMGVTSAPALARFAAKAEAIGSSWRLRSKTSVASVTVSTWTTAPRRGWEVMNPSDSRIGSASLTGMRETSSRSAISRLLSFDPIASSPVMIWWPPPCACTSP